MRLYAVLAAGVALWAGVTPLSAQALRGEVGEDKVNAELLNRLPLAARRGIFDPKPVATVDDEQNGIPAEPYEPVAEEPIEPVPPSANQSLFGQTTGDTDILGNPVEPPRPARRPSTSAARSDSENDTSERNTRTGRATPENAEDADNERTSAAGATSTDEDTDETLTGTVRAGTVDSETELTVDAGAERASAIEGLERRPDPEDPYAPVGIRAGTFILRPSLETGATFTDNANGGPGGDSSILSETTLRLNAASDWARNSARLDAYGTFRKSVDGAEIEETEISVDGSAEIELGNEFRALGTIGYLRRPEDASSPVEIENVVTRPTRQTFDGSLGLAKDVGKARFSVTGKVERQVYGDALLEGGLPLSQEERNSTLASLALRGGYEISPALTPFVELEYGRRVMDLKVDTAGYDRSADRMAARAGLELSLNEKLTGEFSAGWLRETLDDDRLAPVFGATLNADLTWSPVRGTNVRLNGSTEVETGTDVDESGSILYTSRLAIDHQLRANLTGTMTLGANYRDYSGSSEHDLTLSAEAGLTWWLNRYAGLTTRVRHERLTSSLPDRDSTTNSVFLGLKVQR